MSKSGLCFSPPDRVFIHNPNESQWATGDEKQLPEEKCWLHRRPFGKQTALKDCKTIRSTRNYNVCFTKNNRARVSVRSGGLNSSPCKQTACLHGSQQPC